MEQDSIGGMKNRHRNIENLGFLPDMGGVKIFHCGDTNPLNREAFVAHFREVDHVTIFEEKMASIQIDIHP
jgi:hypothetical protein